MNDRLQVSSARAEAVQSSEGSRPAAASRAKYLDGLRGISIVPVLLGHAFAADSLPAPLRFAFDARMGVGVFFVVSGYIITRLLIGEREANGTVRIAAFYGRRFAKLMPVLWLYLAGIVLLQRFVALDCAPSQLVAAAVLATGFLQTGTWYVGHFWSLTVEEIFYVTWAPAVTRLSRRSTIVLAATTAVSAVAFRTLNVAARSNHFSHAFAWWPQLPVLPELDAVAIGSLAALAEPRVLPLMQAWGASKRALLALVSWAVGLGLLALVLEQASHDAALVRWLLAVLRVPCAAIAVAVIILIARFDPKAGASRWLEARPIVALGRASYSIYVVQELFCIPAQWRMSVWFQQPPWNVLCATVVGCSLFYWFEDPIRLRIVRSLGLERLTNPEPAR